ncbi:hypothetical protein J3Q64DRAFT_1698115 [Phycomyces blakesleeanus]|uniref:Uncharacterized protein n=2 Tax=Phycomyces blakesleeanus TaxID=4837 RepID=A0A167NBJ7_PHYB8|nr:hypothetical protein PHYBLDRAFT_64515 [Phycomyces blakesleeanus NRRL 1555(-)]OAD75608.1 hypothetical protein PHYBLDRAFT_64515 [Phycomyces blakesleeanus NRRL 1555(-)]|eukprot:XP_018293648.1 hypothetical protein PHYBLDRAFT_64515 [Phycomyces blakesleeanus NRRL 1555(-)]
MTPLMLCTSLVILFVLKQGSILELQAQKSHEHTQEYNIRRPICYTILGQAHKLIYKNTGRIWVLTLLHTGSVWKFSRGKGVLCTIGFQANNLLTPELLYWDLFYRTRSVNIVPQSLGESPRIRIRDLDQQICTVIHANLREEEENILTKQRRQ